MDLRVLEHSGEAYPQENELVDRSIVQLEASGAADKNMCTRSNIIWKYFPMISLHFTPALASRQWMLTGKVLSGPI